MTGGEDVAPIRLVALDIDGTLLRSDRAMSPRTRAALVRSRAAGVRVVLVTGRRLPSARRVAEELGGEVPLVLYNGALVVEKGEIVRSLLLPRTVARRAIRAGGGAEAVLHCGALGEGRLVVREAARRSSLVRYYLERSEGDVETVSDLSEAVEREEPVQIMFGGTRAEMERLESSLREALGDDARIERSVYPSTGVVLLEVLERTVGKAEAVAFLQRRWGVAPAETLAIGDNWNDREMVARAGRGFVMGNAAPELLALGLPVLPTNDEDGVAHALEAHVLRDVPFDS